MFADNQEYDLDLCVSVYLPHINMNTHPLHDNMIDIHNNKQCGWEGLTMCMLHDVFTLLWNVCNISQKTKWYRPAANYTYYC